MPPGGLSRTRIQFWKRREIGHNMEVHRSRYSSVPPMGCPRVHLLVFLGSLNQPVRAGRAVCRLRKPKHLKPKATGCPSNPPGGHFPCSRPLVCHATITGAFISRVIVAVVVGMRLHD